MFVLWLDGTAGAKRALKHFSYVLHVYYYCLPDLKSLIWQFANELAYLETSNFYLGYRVATVKFIVCYPWPLQALSALVAVYLFYIYTSQPMLNFYKRVLIIELVHMPHVYLLHSLLSS